MKVKIVILNWNGRNVLERFLPSVLANSTGADVIVVDNGSSDRSLEFLRENFPEVYILPLDENYGYAGGYNKALELVGGDIFVLLNSDVETPPGWLEPLVEMIRSDETIAAVSPKILSFNDKSAFEYAGAAGGFIDYLGYPFCRGRILKAVEKDTGQYDDSREVFWASGACMAVRSDIFHSLGGFDAGFFAHMEEIDFCWRAGIAGYKIMSEPAGTVYHLGGGTLPNNSPHKLYLNYRNNLSMLYKNLTPGSVWWVMFLRMFIDFMSAVVFLLQGRKDLFRAVFAAHRDYRRSRPEMKLKRREIQRDRKKKHLKGIYKSSIVLRYMLGVRRFSQLRGNI